MRLSFEPLLSPMCHELFFSDAATAPFGDAQRHRSDRLRAPISYVAVQVYQNLFRDCTLCDQATRQNDAVGGTKSMRSWVIAVIGVAFLTGNAFAQTSDTYVTNEIGSFLPSTLNAAQSSIFQSESLFTGKPYRSAYGYDFGNGFKTEIEGLSSNAASERLGGLAASGNLTTTRVTLKGMYELSDGVWRVKPFVGAGLGMIDVKEQILGVTRGDWAAAYQLRGGVALGFTQKLVGSLEYRWTDGSKPSFSLAGIPTKLEVGRHSFLLGINYKY